MDTINLATIALICATHVAGDWTYGVNFGDYNDTLPPNWTGRDYEIGLHSDFGDSTGFLTTYVGICGGELELQNFSDVEGLDPRGWGYSMYTLLLSGAELVVSIGTVDAPEMLVVVFANNETCVEISGTKGCSSATSGAGVSGFNIIVLAEQIVVQRTVYGGASWLTMVRQPGGVPLGGTCEDGIGDDCLVDWKDRRQRMLLGDGHMPTILRIRGSGPRDQACSGVVGYVGAYDSWAFTRCSVHKCKYCADGSTCGVCDPGLAPDFGDMWCVAQGCVNGTIPFVSSICVPCELVVDDRICLLRQECSWCPASGTCSSPNSPCVSNCSAISAENSHFICKGAPACAWQPDATRVNGGTCLANLEFTDCPTFPSRASCNSSGACVWCDLAANGRGSCMWDSASCSLCLAHRNLSACRTDSLCAWCESRGMCISWTYPYPCTLCADVLSEANCGHGEDRGCVWCMRTGICVATSGISTSSSGSVVLNGENCNCSTYARDNCSRGRCRWCPADAACIDRLWCRACEMYDRSWDACTSKPGCAWSPGDSTCFDRGPEIPCHTYDSPSACTASTACVWCGSSCMQKGVANQCAPPRGRAKLTVGPIVAIAIACTAAAVLVCMVVIVLSLRILRPRLSQTQRTDGAASSDAEFAIELAGIDRLWQASETDGFVEDVWVETGNGSGRPQDVSTTNAATADAISTATTTVAAVATGAEVLATPHKSSVVSAKMFSMSTGIRVSSSGFVFGAVATAKDTAAHFDLINAGDKMVRIELVVCGAPAIRACVAMSMSATESATAMPHTPLATCRRQAPCDVVARDVRPGETVRAVAVAHPRHTFDRRVGSVVVRACDVCTSVAFALASGPSDSIDSDDIVDRKFLGQGGNGSVYKAVWRNAPVVVKTISLDSLGAEFAVKQLQSEIFALMALRAPTIVVMYGAVVSQDGARLLGVAMEFAPLGSLDAVLEKKGDVLGEKIRVLFALDCARALSVIHGLDFIHRDVKAENLLVFSLDPRAAVRAKLTDFGTCKEASNAAEAAAHTRGVGTPIYIAPETGMGKKYSAAADIYSFAILMYLLATGKQPFSEFESEFAVYAHVEAGKRLPIPENCPLGPAIERCWAHDPANRPTAASIATDIAAIAANLADVR